MLRKKESFTVITPIPGFIPRQLAIDILHSHSEVIKVNPLVLDHQPVPAPRDAAADEYYSTWYEITERIQFVPGMGKVGSGKISFKGCFHNMPWGLQTHIYAPMNIDMRSRYRIGGNQPGMEPPETREIGLETLGAPKEGLYLREDIEVKCNFSMISFVRAQVKAASKEMVQRIIKKAELLDAGMLQSMMHGGKLTTLNPNDRTLTLDEKAHDIPAPLHSPAGGFQHLHQQPVSSPSYPSFARPDSSSTGGYTSPNPYQQQQHGYQQSGYQQAGYQHPGYQQPPPGAPPKAQQGIVMELPGDSYYYQPSPNLQPPPLYSGQGQAQQIGQAGQNQGWPHGRSSPSMSDSHRASVGSRVGSAGTSPLVPQQTFASELSAHSETSEAVRR